MKKLKNCRKTVNDNISNWSKDSQKTTNSMINKNGLPSKVTDDMLVWNDVKSFEISIIYKEAITHNSPMEHKDVLERFIHSTEKRRSEASSGGKT